MRDAGEAGRFLRGRVAKVVALAGLWAISADTAFAHPDVSSPEGALSWGISAVIGLAIVAGIWLSARVGRGDDEPEE